MMIGKLYIGAFIGATAYEFQIWRVYVRILRPYWLTYGSGAICWGNVKRLVRFGWHRGDF